MKIGIIGLHGHQVDDLNKRNHGHELEFLGQKSHDKRAIEGLCRRNDRVIVMASCYKAIKAFIPKDKCNVHTGSTSTILRLISEWTKEISPPIKPLVAAKPDKSKKDTQVDTAPPAAEESPLVEIGEDHNGRASLVRKAVTAHPQNEEDTVLIARQVSLSDVGLGHPILAEWIRCPRPYRGHKQLGFEDWRKLVMQAIDQCADEGVVLQAHFWLNYVNLLRIPDNAEAKHVIVDVRLAGERLPRKYKRREFHGPLSTAGAQALHEAIDKPAAETPVVTDRTTLTDREFSVWTVTLNACIRRGDTPHDAATEADQMVERYRKTYN